MLDFGQGRFGGTLCSGGLNLFLSRNADSHSPNQGGHRR
jgi:hypothetical protein